jgi:hypothetical protein
VNVDAMQSNLNQRMKEAKNRERLLKKLAEKKIAQAHALGQTQGQGQTQAQGHTQGHANDEQEIYSEPPPVENLVFSKGETVERSTRESHIKKKKKNKK